VKAFRQSGEKVALDWEREVNALAMMNELQQPHIVRFITAFQRGKQEDLEHYVMFEWADGGNLNNLWKEMSNPVLDASLIKWVIKQLHGLAGALAAAHNMPNGGSYRHGDLKPANILWYRGASTYESWGMLKIGDWGEAKIHKEVTALRHNTTAKTSTRRYEPPETGVQLSKPKETKHARSRLYDIWGIGCITLEFIIWLLYGQDGLSYFNNSNKGQYGNSEMFYELNPEGIAKIHLVVIRWIEHMAKDPVCRTDRTALGDLLQVVRTGLLVVKLPESGGSEPQASLDQPSGTQGVVPSIKIVEPEDERLATVHESEANQDERFRAAELTKQLQRILEVQERDDYWYQNQTPKPPPVESDHSSHLLAPTTRGTKLNSASLRAPHSDRLDYEHESLDPEDWTLVLDNNFAANLLSKLEIVKSISLPTSRPRSANLCDICRRFENWLSKSEFSMSYDTSKLQQNAETQKCALCCLLWQTYHKKSDIGCKTVLLQKQNSTLSLSGAKHSKPSKLTLVRSNGKPAL
jgi:serine/threonine protein kinase